MSRAIVFAAGGLIGYHVAKALVADGWKVTGVVRSSFDAHQLLLIGATPLVGSAEDEKLYESALADATLVVEAGLHDLPAAFQGGDPVATLRKIVELSVKLTNPGAKKRFIFTSGALSLLPRLRSSKRTQLALILLFQLLFLLLFMVLGLVLLNCCLATTRKQKRLTFPKILPSVLVLFMLKMLQQLMLPLPTLILEQLLVNHS